MKDSRDENWVRQMIPVLKSLLDKPNMPILDIEWLLLRCEDTLNYPESLRQDSLIQLRKDFDDFKAEFPEALPQELSGSPA